MAPVSDTVVDRHTELAALFRRGIAGDAACYSEFLLETSAILRRAVGKRVPAGDVEDVVQEVLISVHKARHTYDGQRPLMPWLYAIAQFRVNDHLRKRYSGVRWEAMDIDDLSETLPAVTEPASATEYIEELLNPVPERDRQILTMMHVEGRTAKETGQQLGISESAVKVAAHRAIRKIREAFRT